MKLKPMSATVAVLVGLAQTCLLVLCWAYIAAHSPLPRWLIDLGLQGHAFRAALLPIDFLTSVLLSLPAAHLLLKLRPGKLWPYLILAVFPGFIWLNRGLVGNPLPIQFAGEIALGWIPELFALPAAAWLLRFMSGAPNNSFKPKPLRGSA
ncbi:hypothetical protein [Lysobacter sp. P5_B9]